MPHDHWHRTVRLSCLVQGEARAVYLSRFDPGDWKPMPTVGSGVREIRVREQGGAFRVIYVAKLADRVYVLHCFQKRTQQTARADLELAGIRYRQVIAKIQDRAGEQT